MVAEPRVSVIIPSHNRLRLLQACLESVFSQRLDGDDTMEVIVVDDSSSDGTFAFLQECAKQHPCLKPVRVECGNVSLARNAGIDAASGEYIRFADNDDELTPDSLRVMIEAAADGANDLVIGNFDRRAAGPVNTRRLIKKDESLDMASFAGMFNKYVTSYTMGVVWNKLFRRDIIAENGLRFVPGLTYGEDFLFVLEYMKYCRFIRLVTAPVYVYFFNPRSLTTRQLYSCVTHPVLNINVKKQLYAGYKDTFRHLGLYSRYRRIIRLYMFRVNLYD